MPAWLEEALAVSRLALDDSFPRDVVAIAEAALPVSFVVLPGLTTSRVRAWLERAGVPQAHATANRALHGCIVARAGTAIIFLDREDAPEEQRLTAAHELGHFVVDHVVPRTRALKQYGETIRAVLDGVRGPSPSERISSALDGVPIGTRVHLMPRTESGRICTWAVDEAERKADEIALELLAPASVVRPMVRGASTPEATNAAVRAVAQRFALPDHAAATRVASVMPRRRTSTLDFIQG